MENVNEVNPYAKGIGKIHIKSQVRHLSLDSEKVQFCKAEGSYTRVILEGNCTDILVSQPLKIFRRCLPKEGFLRCHNTYLINVKNVQSFDSKKKILVFVGCHIPVSRRKASHIFNILSEIGIQDIKNDDQI